MVLKRRFTPLVLLMISINGMVGSAWLFTPLYAAKIAGSAAIISWLIGGLGTMLIALTFAELSVMFPVTGGSAFLPNLSHGRFFQNNSARLLQCPRQGLRMELH